MAERSSSKWYCWASEASGLLSALAETLLRPPPFGAFDPSDLELIEFDQ